MNTRDIISPGESRIARYGGAGETSAVRQATIREIVKVQSGLILEKPTERIHLNDTKRLTEACKRYLDICTEHGLIPSFQGLAGLCGVSRMALYDFLKANPDHPSGILLERCRTSFLYMRQSAVDRGAAAESQAIFIAKNTYQNYQDRLEIEPIQSHNPLDNLDDEDATRRILANKPIRRLIDTTNDHGLEVKP